MDGFYHYCDQISNKKPQMFVHHGGKAWRPERDMRWMLVFGRLAPVWLLVQTWAPACRSMWAMCSRKRPWAGHQEPWAFRSPAWMPVFSLFCASWRYWSLITVTNFAYPLVLNSELSTGSSRKSVWGLFDTPLLNSVSSSIKWEQSMHVYLNIQCKVQKHSKLGKQFMNAKH